MTIVMLFICLALFLTACGGSAAPAAEGERAQAPLDDGWTFGLDADGTATLETWAAGAAAGTVALPASRPFDGQAQAAWYAREITLPGDGDRETVALVFSYPRGAITVYLDGDQAGHFLGVGLPHRLLLRGKGGARHRLTLRLAHAGLPAGIAPAHCGPGWAALEWQPPVRVASLTAVMDPASNQVRVRFRLVADTPVVASLRLEVLSAERKAPLARHTMTVTPTPDGANGDHQIAIKRLQWWAPKTPDHRYRLRASLLVGGKAVDVREIDVGGSRVEWRDGRLWVNGDAVQLRGVRMAGTVSVRSREAFEALTARELALIRQAGFNAVMAEGAALPEAVLDAANREGLFVIGEIPPLPADGDAARAQIEAAVAAYGRHPSLIAWSWESAGAGDANIAMLRALDPARPLLPRVGGDIRLIAPQATDGQPCVNLDLNLAAGDAATWWSRFAELEEQSLPVLASGIGITAAADDAVVYVRGNSTQQDEALALLRTVVESLRQSPRLTLLGYFVRLPAMSTLTGLGTAAGVPTTAFTTALAFNQPCTIFIRAPRRVAVGERVPLEAVLVNDMRLTGTFRLYQVVATPLNAQTLITGREIVLTGKTVQDDLQKYLAFTPTEAGEYQLKLVLARDHEVITTTQVVRMEAEGQAGTPANGPVTPSNQ